MSYNGWKNWATWNIALWIDKEEPSYRARMRAEPRTADEAEAFAKSIFPNGTPDFDNKAADYENVDWEEVADHWKSDYEERTSP